MSACCPIAVTGQCHYQIDDWLSRHLPHTWRCPAVSWLPLALQGGAHHACILICVSCPRTMKSKQLLLCILWGVLHERIWIQGQRSWRRLWQLWGWRREAPPSRGLKGFGWLRAPHWTSWIASTLRKALLLPKAQKRLRSFKRQPSQ